jgi:hypothetical protein
MNLPIVRGTVAAALASTAITAHASCGSAFCFVNTNWSVQGVWVEPGPRFDFRYEYIDQDQPRAGSGKVAVGQIPQDHEEVYTKNNNFFATVDYGFNDAWGASLVVPIVNRRHQHIEGVEAAHSRLVRAKHDGEEHGDNEHDAPVVEQWEFTRLSDIRVQGRWQTMLANADTRRARFAGATFGLKLPTGQFDVQNGDGETAERSLQPGTGTTDVIVGGYYRETLPFDNWSWFLQAAGQFALNSRDGYKPGNQIGVDLGYRYDVNERLGLMLQLNYRYKARDSGAQAEPDDSGGQTVSLSPGVSYTFAPNWQVYGYVQVPIYQYVNGVQLTADWSVTAGLNVQF